MFMVVPSKANFNVLLGREWMHGVGAVPSTLHQKIAIWREDGLVENIEADQSYFLAEVNNITKKNFDKQLATIPPCMSLGPKYVVSEDEMYTMKLHPDNTLRTRASTYGKVLDNLTPECPAYAISPTEWDVEE